MEGIVRNRNKDWEREDLQRKLLAEIKALYKIRKIIDAPDMFITLTDFIFDQFPVGEKDREDNQASAEWWDASFAFENKIVEYTLDEFYQMVTHTLKVNKEEET